MSSSRTNTLDQLDAAVRQQQAAFAKAGKKNATSARLRARLEHLLEFFEGGHMQVCEHIEAGPRPAFTSLNQDAIVCEECLRALTTPYEWEGPCDLCDWGESHGYGSVLGATVRIVVRVDFMQVAMQLCAPCYLELEVCP